MVSRAKTRLEVAQPIIAITVRHIILENGYGRDARVADSFAKKFPFGALRQDKLFKLPT